MPKKSLIDIRIEELMAQIKEREAAINVLRSVKNITPRRTKPRVVKKPDEKTA